MKSLDGTFHRAHFEHFWLPGRSIRDYGPLVRVHTYPSSMQIAKFLYEPSASPIAFFTAGRPRPLPRGNGFAGLIPSTFAGFLPNPSATEGSWYESMPTRI